MLSILYTYQSGLYSPGMSMIVDIIGMSGRQLIYIETAIYNLN